MIRFLQNSGATKKIVLGGIAAGYLRVDGDYVYSRRAEFGDLTGTPGKGSVAKVDGTDITADEVRQTARQMAQQEAQRYGEMAAKIMPFLFSRRRRARSTR